VFEGMPKSTVPTVEEFATYLIGKHPLLTSK
jgi:hypothetical protein